MQETRLELLVRDDAGEEGFSIKELPSGKAYASFRPVRIPREDYEESASVSPVNGRKHYVLKAKASGEYVSVNDREYYVWSQMDGDRSVRDIVTACFMEFGTLDIALAGGLLSKLRVAGLIELVPAADLVVMPGPGRGGSMKRLRSRLLRVDLRWEGVDGLITRFYEKGGYVLVNKFSMLLYVALSVFGLTAFGRLDGLARFPYRLFVEHPVATVLAAVACILPVAVVHELFHALACKKYGRKVNAFGFTLWDGFCPGIYTDVSDVYMASRMDRFHVALAGPLSTVALAAFFFMPALMSPGWRWAELSYEVGRLNLFIGFISFYPFQFMKMDGYYMLADLLGVTGLRERSFALVKGLPARVKAGKAPSAEEAVLLAYFFLSLFSILLVYYLIFHS